MYRVLLFFLLTIPAMAQQPNIYFEQIPARRILYADCANEIKIFSKCTTCSELTVTATNAEILKSEKEETYLIVPNKREDLGWGILQPLPVTLYVKYSYKDSWHTDSLVFGNVEELPTPELSVIILPKIQYTRIGEIKNTLQERLNRVILHLIANDNYFSNFCSSDKSYRANKIEVKIISQKNRKMEKQIAVIDNTKGTVDLWAFLKKENLKKYNLVAIRCLSFDRKDFRGKILSYESSTNWYYIDLDSHY
jgi:hypothetical protein